MLEYKPNKIFSRISNEIKLFLFIGLFISAFFVRTLSHLWIFFGVVLLLLIVAEYTKLASLLFRLLITVFFISVGVYVFFHNSSLNVIDLITAMTLRFLILALLFTLFAYTTDFYVIVKISKKLRIPKTIYITLYLLLRFLPEMERNYADIIELRKVEKINAWKNPIKFAKFHLLPMIFVSIEKAEDISYALYLKGDRLFGTFKNK